MLKIEEKNGRKSRILMDLSVEEINDKPDELFKGATIFSRVSKQLVPGDQQ